MSVRCFSRALACAGVFLTVASAAPCFAATSASEREFARTVAPLTANDVTANLPGNVGKHVAFRCEVIAVVDAGAIIGQCGKDIEPVDLYVHLRTAGLRTGERLRVLGEMEPPSQWVDINGHTWFTGFVKAKYVERR